MPDRNGNENCLENYQCPNCGNHETLRIQCVTMVKMTDMGSEEHEDLEWDENSYMECPQCHHNGKSSLFHIPELQADA